MNIEYSKTDLDFVTICRKVFDLLPEKVTIMVHCLDSSPAVEVLNSYGIKATIIQNNSYVSKDSFERLLSVISWSYNEVWFFGGEIGNVTHEDLLVGPVEHNSISSLNRDWLIESLPAIGVGDGNGANYGFVSCQIDELWNRIYRSIEST